MENGTTIVRFFGSLHALRRQSGLPVAAEIQLGEERQAIEIARDFDLPMERIAAVYCNHVPRDLNHRVRPGDRIAFAPRDVPGLRRTALASPWG